MASNISDGHTHFVLVWRKILFVNLDRDKHCFVLILYSTYLYFLYFVTITFAFCENYSPPQIRNKRAPNLGRWSFCENEIYARFSSQNVRYLCINCLFINLIKFYMCFEKFYKIFLSLIAVKVPPHIRRLFPKYKANQFMV